MTTIGSSADKLPVANAVPSFWRSEVGPIDTHRTTEDLESSADIVIIGAGYAGASIAYHILEESAQCNRPAPSILILEAREACSGATGRNGGHLKPDPIYRASSVLETHGKEIAEHVSSFEARHIDAIKDLVVREGIDCDFETTKVHDVCFYDAGRNRSKATLARLVNAGISTAKDVRYRSGTEAEEVSGVKGAQSCLTYNAARLWPYKLVAHLLEKAVSQGVHLQTFTPVTSILPADKYAREQRWIVQTPRGAVKTNAVVYATNGYASALLPEMKDKIVPVRGMVARLAGANAPKLEDSYLMRFSEHEYDYMISRPDGSIVLGGARRDFFKDLDEWFDVVDDSKLMEGARGYFDGYMQRHFLGWENSGLRAEEIWTGIMGYSNDGFPYVGPVPGRSGQYICAGFTGHGMPQIFLSAKAIAATVLQGDMDGVDLPLPYRISEARWAEPKAHASLVAWQRFRDSAPARAVL